MPDKYPKHTIFIQKCKYNEYNINFWNKKLNISDKKHKFYDKNHESINKVWNDLKIKLNDDREWCWYSNKLP